jgi:phage tail P2-like protein
MAVKSRGRWVDYLPAILQQGKFIGPFLSGLERLSSGPPEGAAALPPTPDGVDLNQIEGLEQTLSRIHTFFDPEQAPEDFLPWLAGWVATSLTDEWSVETRRAFIGSVVKLYKKRGTADGLRDVLRLHTQGYAVLDPEEDGVPPHFSAASPAHLFKVMIEVSGDAEAVAKKVRQVISVVDQWKPAHTYYPLDYSLFGMQINNDSCTPRLLLDPSYTTTPCDAGFGPGVQIGVTTLVGTSSKAPEIKLEAMQINDDPNLYPEFGSGILVGIDMLLGTEP